MFEHCPVNLQMTKMNLEDGFFDENSYRCEVIRYDEERECIYLLLLDAGLPDISLDARYRCLISGEEELVCQGRIAERFIDRRGNVMVLLVENGFYKNNLN